MDGKSLCIEVGRRERGRVGVMKWEGGSGCDEVGEWV